MGLFCGKAPAEKMTERLGRTDVRTSITSSAAICGRIVWEDGEQYIIPEGQWPAYAASRGLCWNCNDRFPDGAAFCITCGAEIPQTAATGETTRL